MLSTLQLLSQNEQPNDKEMRKAIAGNTCRCTGYQNILKSNSTGGAEHEKAFETWRSSLPESLKSSATPDYVYDFL